MGEEEELGEGSFTDLRSPLILVILRQRASHTYPRQAQYLPFIKNVLCSGQEYYQFKAGAHQFTEDDHNMWPKEGQMEKTILESPSREGFLTAVEGRHRGKFEVLTPQTRDQKSCKLASWRFRFVRQFVFITFEFTSPFWYEHVLSLNKMYFIHSGIESWIECVAGHRKQRAWACILEKPPFPGDWWCLLAQSMMGHSSQSPQSRSRTYWEM